MGFLIDAMTAAADTMPSADDPPIPLSSAMAASEAYPLDALGDVLANAAAAICRKVQVPAAIAAQSVLSTAALAAQVHADVVLPYGQERPLSLYFVTIAESGDRKSTADNEALWPVRKREKRLKEEYERDYGIWSIEHAAWMAEKRKIEGKAGLGLDGRKSALGVLGAEPRGPLYPFLTAPDPTVEGLAKAWVAAPASLGIFTAEGGQFIGGYGMSLDNRLKTAATFSQSWDGQPSSAFAPWTVSRSCMAAASLCTSWCSLPPPLPSCAIPCSETRASSPGRWSRRRRALQGQDSTEPRLPKTRAA